MKKGRIPVALGGFLVLGGIVFGICYPKKVDFLENFTRPDAVMSLGLTLGLIGSGAILMITRWENHVRAALCIALLWSLLFNWSMASLLADQRAFTSTMLEAEAREAKATLARLETGDAKDLTVAKEQLRNEIEVKTRLSGGTR